MNLTSSNTLGQLAFVGSGYHVRGRISHSPQGNTLIVQMSDVSPKGAIAYDNLSRIHLDKIGPQYFLKKGDVLLTGKGYRNNAAAITEDSDRLVASSHFYVIRLRESTPALPEFVAWYLNQNSTQRQLAKYRNASSIPLLSRDDFQNLNIPLPPLEVQKKITATNELLQQEKEILEKIDSLRSQLVQKQLLTKVSSYENGGTNV